MPIPGIQLNRSPNFPEPLAILHSCSSSRPMWPCTYCHCPPSWDSLLRSNCLCPWAYSDWMSSEPGSSNPSRVARQQAKHSQPKCMGDRIPWPRTTQKPHSSWVTTISDPLELLLNAGYSAYKHVALNAKMTPTHPKDSRSKQKIVTLGVSRHSLAHRF